MSTIDPITLEVLRHRLMMINDEQGRVAANLSGSPVVYEAKDFNSALLTAEGDSLFIGVYMTRLSLCLNTAVKTTIAQFGETLGFREGDAFVTNDPWAGAAHMNDILMFAPIFHEGRLIFWTGLAMHEIDVGGPNPGSFTIGTRDVFGEAPLIPPVKLIDQGVVREDVAALLVRNSRTPAINGLNVRARIAAINRTRDRIAEVVAEYGIEAVMAAQGRILELVQSSFARRLRSLPDGRWHARGYIDHDGNTNTLYRIRLAMTKCADRLRFDFTGTDAQAPGAINCTRVGLESGIFSAILPLLCYDIPWSPGAIMPLVDIVSEPGTINNALHPAAVSMATVSGTFATAHVAFDAIAKMIACSELKDEIQANWTPAWQGMAMAGRWKDGRSFTSVFLDNTGGGGARAGHDGLDAGGLPGAPAMAIGNVETYEQENPVLYVFRKLAADTGGHGLHRGGAGTQSLVIPHGSEGESDVTVLTHGASQPEAQGLFGGYPSSVQVRLKLHDTCLSKMFAEGNMPERYDEVACRRVETLAAKQRTLLGENDAVLIVCAGGGGYGDAIQRDPERVLGDVEQGLVSREVAASVYGVVIRESGAPAVDVIATDEARQLISSRRLAEGTSVDDAAAFRREEVTFSSQHGMGHAARVGTVAGREILSCSHCEQPLAELGEDPKRGALWRHASIEILSKWNRFGLADEIVVMEFCCPSCGHLLGTQVTRRDDPIELDSFMEPSRATSAKQALA